MTPRTVQSWMAGAILAASLIAPVAASAQVVVVANGSPITELDISQRTKLMATSGNKNVTRQDVVKELIDEHGRPIYISTDFAEFHIYPPGRES